MDEAIQELTAERSSSEPEDLRGLNLADLERIVADAGERPYRARQIAHWLYRKSAGSIDEMRDLPASLRSFLKDRFRISSLEIVTVRRSADNTRKLLLRLHDGAEIETVIIPAAGRVTLCMSSQAGCAMGCAFCATALMGLRRNLSAGEILSQIVAARTFLDPGQSLTNYVFMGMGEPLANYPRLLRTLNAMTSPWGMAISPRRITVSTVGLLPMMERLLADTPVNLAVSLHATTDEVRDRIAPINRRYPLKQLLDTCARLPLKRRNRITFEYVMLAGVNDSPADARRLVKMMAPLRAKVNLIFFNPFEGAHFRATERTAVEGFQAILQKGNLTATIRESRGADIAAACGQLYAENRAASRPALSTHPH